VAVACKRCHWCAEHVGGVNLWANTGLTAIKLAGGILGNSQALVADATHSLSDIVISILLIISLRVSNAPPDEDHHWGHGNIEFIVSCIIGTLLICAAITITVMAMVSVIEGTEHRPSIVAVWAAAISIVSNEILFRHSLCIGEQMESPAMIANAWENRSDVYSSVAAMIGVFGASMGFTFLDPLAAIVVSFMIGRTGVHTLNMGLKGITDLTADQVLLDRIKHIVLANGVVKNVSRLRARKVGQKHWVDLEASFEPQIKIAEAKRIIDRAKQQVMKEFDGVADVVIISRVVDPELKEI